MVNVAGDHPGAFADHSHDFLERTFFGHVAMVKDADGKVTGLTTRYGDRDFAAHRIAPQ